MISSQGLKILVSVVRFHLWAPNIEQKQWLTEVLDLPLPLNFLNTFEYSVGIQNMEKVLKGSTLLLAFVRDQSLARIGMSII